MPNEVEAVPEGDSPFKNEVFGERSPLDYFDDRIAFVLIRGVWAQKVKAFSEIEYTQTGQDEFDNKLVAINNHLENALKITTKQVFDKVKIQNIVSDILAGATPLGTFSDIYESVDDTNAITEALGEINSALLTAQELSEPFNEPTKQTKSIESYKLEANLIAMQAAQFFSYENKPELVDYYLNWESNFEIQFQYAVLVPSIRQGKGGYVSIYATCTKVDENKRWCKFYSSRLVEVYPDIKIKVCKKASSSFSRFSDLCVDEDEKFYFYQPALFEPILGELHGQNVKELIQMKKYIVSKQKDEIPDIRQRISNMQKKLFVPWRPNTIPEPKMVDIHDNFADIQKGGLLGLLSEFNESKVRKNSSSEYIYIDEISKIQAFSGLLNRTPTSEDFEKYYETRLLTIKKDLNELDGKYSSESFIVSRKILNFYNLQ